MVDRVSALLIDDSADIELPDNASGVHTHSDCVNKGVSLQSPLILGGDRLVAVGLGCKPCSFIRAGSVCPSLVVLIAHKSACKSDISIDVFQGALISLEAVYNLLSAEFDELPSLHKVEGFHSPDCDFDDRRVAGTDRHDRSHSALSHPILFIGQISVMLWCRLQSALNRDEILSGELLLSEIGELIDAEFESGLGLINLMDLQEVVPEYPVSALSLLCSLISIGPVLREKFRECLLDFEFSCGGQNHQCQKECHLFRQSMDYSGDLT